MIYLVGMSRGRGCHYHRIHFLHQQGVHLAVSPIDLIVVYRRGRHRSRLLAGCHECRHRCRRRQLLNEQRRHRRRLRGSNFIVVTLFLFRKSLLSGRLEAGRRRGRRRHVFLIDAVHVLKVAEHIIHHRRHSTSKEAHVPEAQVSGPHMTDKIILQLYVAPHSGQQKLSMV